MKLTLKSMVLALSVLTLMTAHPYSVAFASDDTAKEKVKEAANDTKRAAKKAVRKAKDETCEMVDGKMKCMGQKMKHAAQNAGDKIEDAVD